MTHCAVEVRGIAREALFVAKQNEESTISGVPSSFKPLPVVFLKNINFPELCILPPKNAVLVNAGEVGGTSGWESPQGLKAARVDPSKTRLLARFLATTRNKAHLSWR